MEKIYINERDPTLETMQKIATDFNQHRSAIKVTTKMVYGWFGRRRKKKAGGVFECGQCDKKYKSRQALKEHIQCIHEGRRFVCGECNKEFHHKTNLLKHIHAKHQNHEDETLLVYDIVANYADNTVDDNVYWEEVQGDRAETVSSSDDLDILDISPEKELAMMNLTSDEDHNGYVPLYEDDVVENSDYFSNLPPINTTGSLWEDPAIIEDRIQQLQSQLTVVNALIDLHQRPFFLYAEDFHAVVRCDMPEESTDNEVAVELRRRWDELGGDEKSKYEQQAEKNKVLCEEHNAGFKSEL